MKEFFLINVYLKQIFIFLTLFLPMFLENCIGKMFILTPAKASFEKSRGMCLALGGDVVQKVVGEEGKKYHRLYDY